MVGPHDRRINHLHRSRRPILLTQGTEHQLEDAGLRPTTELLVDRVPIAEILVQIPPRRSGSSDPEYPVENPPVILGRPSALAACRYDKRLKKQPLLIRHQSANQDCLPKSSLESLFATFVNLLCQQDLAQSMIIVCDKRETLILNRTLSIRD